MGKKALCSKICLVAILILINIFAVLLSLILIAAGIAIVVVSTQNNINIQQLVALITTIFTLGVLFLLISILGLISSISSIPSKHAFRVFSTCFLTVYMVVLLVLILVQIGVVIAGIFLRQQVASQSTIEGIFTGFIGLYNTQPAIMSIIDGWQQGFSCCGYNNLSNWFVNGSNFTQPNLPMSCCSANATMMGRMCMSGIAFPSGCSQALIGLVSEYLGAVIGVFAAIAFFQVAILVFNLVLICCIWLDKPSAAYRFREGSIFAAESYMMNK